MWNPGNRPAMRLLAAVVLAFVLFASIALFAFLRGRGNDVDVVVSGLTPTASPLPAPVLVATPIPPTAAVVVTPLTPTAIATTAPTATTTPMVVTATPVPSVVAAAPQSTAPEQTPFGATPVVALPTGAAAPAAGPPAGAPPAAAQPAPQPPTAPAPAPPPTQPPVAAKPAVVATTPPQAAPTATQPPPAPPAQPPAAAKPKPAGGTSVDLDPGEAAELRCPDNRVVVTVLPGAFQRPVTIICRRADLGAVPQPPGRRIGDILFELESNTGPTLPAEVNLGVNYRTEDLAGANEQELVIAVLEGGQWRPAPKLVTDPPNNFVSATVTRLGVYTLYQRS